MTPAPPSATPDLPPAPLVGLTGAPAAGKSTVAEILRGAGCVVVDADALGHRALGEPAVRDAIVARLGPGVLRADGAIDRGAVARVVFDDPERLAALERIVHPRVRALLRDEVAHARATAAPAVVLDVALLFEGGLSEICDVTVTVDAPRTTRQERAASRGWDEHELARRESRQLSAAEKRARADRVLENDGDIDRLRESALRLLAELTGGRDSAGTEGETP